ncbi:MAG: hypothetical protein J6K45_07735 [Clostridia bacterium]|nr:hypothetical protein [Clostridia bacterium]
MKFGEKISKAIKKIKGKLIVSFILWLILIIVFVAPTGLAFCEAFKQVGDARWEALFLTLGKYIVKPWEAIALCVVGESNGYFWATLWRFTVVYLFAVIVGISKALPKHEYDGIENGSSDWCTNGEQYKVLSNKEGIILAEKNYLPVDKRGNVNVLVVGRIWCW